MLLDVQLDAVQLEARDLDLVGQERRECELELAALEPEEQRGLEARRVLDLEPGQSEGRGRQADRGRLEPGGDAELLGPRGPDGLGDPAADAGHDVQDAGDRQDERQPDELEEELHGQPVNLVNSGRPRSRSKSEFRWSSLST